MPKITMHFNSRNEKTKFIATGLVAFKETLFII